MDRLTRYARPVAPLYALALSVATHWPKLALPGPDLGPVAIDKIIHLGAFGLLTLLAILARPAGRSRSWTPNVLSGAALAGTWSYLDELTQGPFGRTVAIDDLLTNLMAVLLAAALVLGELGPRPRTHALAYLARLVLLFCVPVALVFLFVPGYQRATAEFLPWTATIPADALGQSAASLPGMTWRGHLRDDKIGHFVLGLIGAALFILARPLGLGRPWLGGVLAVVCMAGLGPLIEQVQGLTGRGAESTDALVHVAGVAAAAAAILLLWLAWRLLTAQRSSSAAAAAPQSNGGIASHATARGTGTPSDPATASAAAAAPIASAGRHSFVSAARTVGLLTFTSRITGLIRDAYLASAFGLGAVSDAFWFGFAIPNLFRRLFGEGALTAAFIPAYSDLLARDPLIARRLASLCLAATAVLLALLTLLGELALAGTLHAIAWSDDTALAVRLTMVMLPYMPLVCLVALVGSVLQVHGRFAPAAGMPVFLNLVMIAGTWLAISDGTGPDAQRYSVYVVALAVVVAGVVQLLVQSAIMLRYQTLTLVFTGTGPAFRALLRAFVPTFIALSVFQINTFLDGLIAFGLSPKLGGPDRLNLLGITTDYPIRQGGYAALQWAQRLYQFPLGVFGIAIGTAIFPALAHAAAQNPRRPGVHSPSDPATNGPSFQTILHHGLRLTVFIGLPASVGLVLVGLPLSRVIYERGQFDLDASRRVAWVLAAYAPAIWAYSMTHILTRAYYALKDTRTPLVVSVVMVLLNLLLNLTLVWPLGAAGLALSTAVCAVVQCVILLRALGNHLDQPLSPEVWAGWGRTLALSLLMAAILAPVVFTYHPATLGRSSVLLQLAGMVGLGAVAFLAGARLLRMQELRWLLRRRAD